MRTTIALFLFISMQSILGFAQAEKYENRARQKVEALNAQIVSINPALALNEAQEQKILLLYLDQIREYNIALESSDDKEFAKYVFPKYFKLILNELTPEQRKARELAKKRSQKDQVLSEEEQLEEQEKNNEMATENLTLKEIKELKKKRKKELREERKEKKQKLF